MRDEWVLFKDLFLLLFMCMCVGGYGNMFTGARGGQMRTLETPELEF